MANKILWAAAPTSRGNVLSTQMNALADNAFTAQGAEVNNSANLDTYGMFEFNVDPTAAFSAGAFVVIYMITAPDGTNYGEGSASVVPGADTWVLNIALRATADPIIKMTKVFPLPPVKFKFILENQGGKVFPTAGSTLELFTMNYELQ